MKSVKGQSQLISCHVLNLKADVRNRSKSVNARQGNANVKHLNTEETTVYSEVKIV